jgi:putative ABC transport system permease protein
MIKYYLKIAIANLKQSRVYSVISILSLTVGMTASILLLIYVSDEISYDRYHEKADNIYRLCQEDISYQGPQTGKFLADRVPAIERFTRIFPRDNMIVAFGEKRFIENKIAFVDQDLFNIFSFPFVKGNAQTALEDPGTIVISEKMAQKYFGKENPIGKTLRIENELDYNITGVFENMRGNSHFTYDFLLTLSDAEEVYGKSLMNNPGFQNFLVYFLMQDGFSKPELDLMITDLLKVFRNPNDPKAPIVEYNLQSLKDIHLFSSHIKNDIEPQNSINYILIFSAIGLLVLLIACFNYLNLLTANAATRGTEIGIRKTFGAVRSQMAKQFLTESILVLVISTALALTFIGSVLPIFNSITGKELSFLSIINWKNISGILGMMGAVIILAGWYPAFILSSGKITNVLKASKSKSSSGIEFKKILIGIQFTIVIALIASSLVMLRQINFLQKTDLGFEKEAVLISELNFGNQEKYNKLKQNLLSQSIVSSVSAASRVPSGSLSNYGAIRPEGQTDPITIPYVHVQFDYFRALGIKANRGRLFSGDIGTDERESIILNEAAVKSLNIKGDPIGQSLKCNWPPSERKIVGVIGDVHFESMYEIIKPAVFVLYFDECSQLIVKTVSRNSANTINTITKTCQEIYPDEIIEFQFLDSKMQQLYQKDLKAFQLLGFFATISILLACIGLLGMTSFVLVRRTKEIGIRKVNGAGILEIMRLLNQAFVKWLMISFVIATPIAYYGMKKWLENFAYKTSLSWESFALAGIISMVIVLLTVSWLTYRAASRNPIKSLRYE